MHKYEKTRYSEDSFIVEFFSQIISLFSQISA